MNEREDVSTNYFFRVKKRLSEPRDNLDKQFFAISLREIWSSFEAYLGWKYPEDTPRKMRRSFSDVYQKLFETWTMSNYFRSSLKKLCELCPVKDMSPVHPNPPMTINDPSNLFEILDVNYRVRSNLDHGSKELENESVNGTRNRDLVEHSLMTTYEILEKTLSNEKII